MHRVKPILRFIAPSLSLPLELLQDMLNDQQRDWLHFSAFATRDIDFYKVGEGVTNYATRRNRCQSR
jgi:hypothetical protein